MTTYIVSKKWNTSFWKYLYRRLVPETGEAIPIGSFKAQDQTAVLIPAIADWVATVDEQLRKYR